jgi:hypothetical protein|uniref:Uncharacterized protein n=1 Tax=Zea mays TaxID=4577 RepID=A0A804LCB6_MAIZE
MYHLQAFKSYVMVLKSQDYRLVFAVDASADSFRMVNHVESSREPDTRFILVQVFALVQCSAHCSITLRRVLQLVCLCAYEERGILFYTSRDGPYKCV